MTFTDIDFELDLTIDKYKSQKCSSVISRFEHIIDQILILLEEIFLSVWLQGKSYLNIL